MRPWRHLVDEEAVADDEQLNGQQPDDAERLGEAETEGGGLVGLIVGDGRREHRPGQLSRFVVVERHGIDHGLAARSAGHEDRDLGGEGQRLFHHAARGVERGPCCRGVSRLVDAHLATPVEAAGRGFHEARAQRRDRRRALGRGRREGS